MKKIVDIQGLSLRHRPGPCLFSQASLSIYPGETVTLMGPSGSGKTTLALALLGLNPPELEISGQIEVFGSMWGALSLKEMRQRRGKIISMIFQDPSTALHPYFKIRFLLAETLRTYSKVSQTDLEEILVQALREVHLLEPKRILSAYPHELSGGEKQRVMIALALLGRPKLLIADEPTGSLDFVIKVEILKLLQEIQQKRGLSLFLITHNRAIAEKMSDRIYQLENKKMVLEL